MIRLKQIIPKYEKGKRILIVSGQDMDCKYSNPTQPVRCPPDMALLLAGFD